MNAASTSWLQLMVVAPVVAVSAVYAAGQVLPRQRAWVQGHLSRWLAGPVRPAWMQRLGTRMVPTVGSACGSGCTSCGQCAPPDATAQSAQAVQLAQSAQSAQSARPVPRQPGDPQPIRIVRRH